MEKLSVPLPAHHCTVYRWSGRTVYSPQPWPSKHTTPSIMDWLGLLGGWRSVCSIHMSGHISYRLYRPETVRHETDQLRCQPSVHRNNPSFQLFQSDLNHLINQNFNYTNIWKIFEISNVNILCLIQNIQGDSCKISHVFHSHIVHCLEIAYIVQ